MIKLPSFKRFGDGGDSSPAAHSSTDAVVGSQHANEPSSLSGEVKKVASRISSQSQSLSRQGSQRSDKAPAPATVAQESPLRGAVGAVGNNAKSWTLGSSGSASPPASSSSARSPASSGANSGRSAIGRSKSGSGSGSATSGTSSAKTLALEGGVGLGLGIAATASGLVGFVADEKDGAPKQRNGAGELVKRKIEEEVMGGESDMLVKTEEEVRLQLQVTSSMIELIASLPSSLPDPPMRLAVKGNERVPAKRSKHQRDASQDGHLKAKKEVKEAEEEEKKKRVKREHDLQKEEERSKARAGTPLENRKRKHEDLEKGRYSNQGVPRVKEEHRRAGHSEGKVVKKEKEKGRQNPTPRPTASFFAEAHVPSKRHLPSVASSSSKASATPAAVSVATFGSNSASKAGSGTSTSPATTAAAISADGTPTAGTTAVPSPVTEGSSGNKRGVWTDTLFADTAMAYQHLGRKLKRQGEQLYQAFKAAKMAASHSPTAGGASLATGITAGETGEGEEGSQSANKDVEMGAKLASLWMTDACLLYAYSFWCEDQAVVMQKQRQQEAQTSGDASVQSSMQGQHKPGNWHTIFNLIGYVVKLHETHGDKSLLALCKMLEAHILRHLALRQQRSILQRSSEVAISESVEAVRRTVSANLKDSSNGTSGSRSDEAVVSRAVADTYLAKLKELGGDMARTVERLDRSVKLSSQARSALAPQVLIREYPKTWSLLMQEHEKPDQAGETDSMQVDSASGEKQEAPSPPQEVNCFTVDPTLPVEKQKFEWPLPEDPSNVFPSFVCFGRCLLVETAEKAHVQSRFHLQTPMLDAVH